MAPTVPKPKSLEYPYLISQLPRNWAGGSMQWASVATAQTRVHLMKLLAEDVTLHLVYSIVENQTIPEVLASTEIKAELGEIARLDPDTAYELVHVGPAQASAISAALLRGMNLRGVSLDDLAKRMRLRRAVVMRLTDLFNFNHNEAMVRRAAELLDMRLDFRVVPLEGPRNPDDLLLELPLV